MLILPSSRAGPFAPTKVVLFCSQVLHNRIPGKQPGPFWKPDKPRFCLPQHTRRWRRIFSKIELAEREGFEPSTPFWSVHAFQACAFNHSAISPPETALCQACRIFQFKSPWIAAASFPPETPEIKSKHLAGSWSMLAAAVICNDCRTANRTDTPMVLFQ